MSKENWMKYVQMFVLAVLSGITIGVGGVKHLIRVPEEKM